ncbi:MAG: tRNA uridine(34) 5-carboxymethylaminomethyl modification radical SAM/GNAT enzyme Elp3, partial [Patescibacteria group bacterium]|nr:tRNA uridine(34) 5-carboxymethylaminomethyl modification radical SAM/GNAT enzyme Elp3 [Patescibacteria group bacterium]
MAVDKKKQAIQELLKMRVKNRDDLMMVKRSLAKKYQIGILNNSDILKEYQELLAAGVIHKLPLQARLLRKRAIRTLSGIAPVAVLTKSYPCPGKCVYCPTEKDVPQSYLSNEPAVMRAIRCGYNPYKQVQMRLKALEANGHEPTKIELIVIGGTWSVLPRKYKYWYALNLFAGANKFRKINNQKIPNTQYPKNLSFKKISEFLKIEQEKNEKAKYKIVGLTLETRPDYINEKELWEMRELGCTRIEVGVQAIDDKILKLNRRGHGVAAIARATRMLKNFGFKVTYHIMPGLPGSTPAKDYKMFKQLFDDERFQPDQIKFYPTVVTTGSLLYKWWKMGKYKPYSGKQLENLIVKCKAIVPPYVRIIRLIRDIPGESIIAGNMITNLRQIMQDKGVKCNCIRCREPRDKQLKITPGQEQVNYKLRIIKYLAAGGEEHFIFYESKDGKILYGFCRLRLSGSETFSFNAMIRELHVYGELVPIGSNKKVQHAGLGKKLMQTAEKIARQNGHEKIAVISGIGVRGYYRKLGYRLHNTYMTKR